MDCEYKPNDIVPIAVGVALACLVVAVLVAYMVGRRRNRQNGYQSVWISSKVLNAVKIDKLLVKKLTFVISRNVTVIFYSKEHFLRFLKCKEYSQAKQLAVVNMVVFTC